MNTNNDYDKTEMAQNGATSLGKGKRKGIFNLGLRKMS
jgi:hypothetical protein